MAEKEREEVHMLDEKDLLAIGQLIDQKLEQKLEEKLALE